MCGRSRSKVNECPKSREKESRRCQNCIDGVGANHSVPKPHHRGSVRTLIVTGEDEPEAVPSPDAAGIGDE